MVMHDDGDVSTGIDDSFRPPTFEHWRAQVAAHVLDTVAWHDGLGKVVKAGKHRKARRRRRKPPAARGPARPSPPRWPAHTTGPAIPRLMIVPTTGRSRRPGSAGR